MSCCLNKRRVRVNPDQSSFTLLYRENPYIALTNTDDNDTVSMTIPQDILDKARQIDQMTCSIRFICMCDIAMSILYCYYNIFIGLLTAFASFNGYISTIYHRQSMMCCYLMYQIIQVVARILNVILYVYMINTPVLITSHVNATDANATDSNISDANATSSYIIMVGTPVDNIIILSIMAGIQVYIFCYINKYYQLLPTDQEKLRIEHAQHGIL